MTTSERPGSWPYDADQPAVAQPAAAEQPYVEPPIGGLPYHGLPAMDAQPYYAPPIPVPQYQPVPSPQPLTQPYPLYAPAATNGMAIAAMVLGILWLYWVGSILALIFGYVARDQIKRTGESGDGMAIAGIVLGWVGIGFLALGVLVAATT